MFTLMRANKQFARGMGRE